MNKFNGKERTITQPIRIREGSSGGGGMMLCVESLLGSALRNQLFSSFEISRIGMCTLELYEVGKTAQVVGHIYREW